MKTLIIEATNYSPRMELNAKGEITIRGKSIVEDAVKFYTPVFRWVRSCTFSTLKVKIKIDYMNNNSSKQIFNLLNLIRHNHHVKNVYISWYFETGDDGILELGKEFESRLNLPFDFLQYSTIEL
jgi:hypothetical protein